MDYLEHVTIDGDRWDLVAWRYYGDALRIEELIRVNAHVAITPTIKGGTRLVIPFLDLSKRISSDKLPPWKRNA